MLADVCFLVLQPNMTSSCLSKQLPCKHKTDEFFSHALSLTGISPTADEVFTEFVTVTLACSFAYFSLYISENIYRIQQSCLWKVERWGNTGAPSFYIAFNFIRLCTRMTSFLVQISLCKYSRRLCGEYPRPQISNDFCNCKMLPGGQQTQFMVNGQSLGLYSIC